MLQTSFRCRSYDFTAASFGPSSAVAAAAAAAGVVAVAAPPSSTSILSSSLAAASFFLSSFLSNSSHVNVSSIFKPNSASTMLRASPSSLSVENGSAALMHSSPEVAVEAIVKSPEKNSSASCCMGAPLRAVCANCGKLILVARTNVEGATGSVVLSRFCSVSRKDVKNRLCAVLAVGWYFSNPRRICGTARKHCTTELR
mmetsp:Transcript_21387/g.61090  ORF Transcript_21387/g.61090 Transcript_21387/m.61090 type:complete len:200 (-) Transcript_21387:258-857(-)